jgi:autotransporter-associated beta strand protein
MKTKLKFHFFTRLSLAAALFALATLPAMATETFTNNIAATGLDWQGTTNWNGGVVPAGGTSDSVQFFPDTNTVLLNGTYSITNTPGTFTLNTLTFSGKGAAAIANTALNIGTAGNTWTFDGTTPTINLNGVNGTKNLNYTVLPNITLNQDLIVTNNGTAGFTFGGLISGSHNINKFGTSTLTLTNANNSFSGTVAINAGMLAFASVGALGNGTNLITLGGGNSANFNYTGNGSVTVTNPITLTGTSQSFINCAAGTTLNYNGTFTGLTNAVLYIQSAGTLNWSSDVTNAGTTVDFAESGAVNFSGAIKVGTSGINQQWSGTTTLNNDSNSFSGSISCTWGTLTFTSIASNGVPSALGAWGTTGLLTVGGGQGDGILNYVGTNTAGHVTDRTVKIGNTVSVTNNARIYANGAGPLVWANTGNFIPTQATYTNNHILWLGGTNTGANEIKGIIIDEAYVASSPTNSITSLIKTNAGKWILSGNNTYRGATTISGGTLLINGSISTNIVTVNNGGTLGGSGTINGAVTVNSGGIIRLGASGSTLTFSNSTAPSYATLTTNLIASSAATLDQISASATTGNSVANVDLVIDTTGLSGNVPSTVIYSAGGAIAGPFHSVTVVGNTSYTPTVDYSTSGQIKLTLAPAPSSYATTMQLTSSLNPSTNLQAVTFTAILKTNGVTATTATGNIVFRVSGTPVATNALASGQSQYIASGLTHSGSPFAVFAEYAGDGIYNGSTNSPALAQVVNLPAAPTTMTNSFNGTALTLSWPANYIGWELQSNAVDVSNPSYWLPVLNSSNVTQVVIPVSLQQTNVFYRLHHP